MEKKTPLYDVHVKEGGKIVPFAGYLLPVQYEQGVIKEHMAVRTAAGLFDVSHMGEIRFTGPTALDTLNYLLTNDFTNMTPGRVRYSPMCNEHGGCVDDVLVYKFADQDYLVVVNAANKDKDFQHMSQYVLEGTKIADVSDSVAQIALQGPASRDILKTFLADEEIPEKYYTALEHVDIDGIDCIVSRTGYTGELGYEIYAPADKAAYIWQLLREKGEPFGCIPCGLGARDTLRLEAAMPLYGHEMDDEITPFEAGLDFAVNMNASDFIGKQVLLEKGTPTHIRVGLEALTRGIMREHQDVYFDGKVVGHTTSGTHAPFIGKAIAMARLDASLAKVGTEVDVDVRGRMVTARVIEMPFINK
ncbi:MAG: glycine cleavage system aminomethyltransferase GcvT [Eggerthellaceae bacterium]|nr:glycine cleavage system aminomethyltransferase GcvT [Eggerthellaceae bacterium]